MAIVDPHHPRHLSEGAVEEIAVAGDHVTPGFRSAETEGIEADPSRRVSLDQRSYPRPGDLGIIRDGEVFVVGRSRDMIIIRGMNIHAEDVEETVMTRFREGEILAAAFAAIPDPLGRAVGDAVAQAHGVVPAEVALTRSLAIARASGGKIKRAAAREAYRAGRFAP